MSKLSVSFKEIKNNMLEDREFREEYEGLRSRSEAIEQIIKARKHNSNCIL